MCSSDLIFHKFIGLTGRCLRPVVVNNDPGMSTWHMWSDAMYLKHPCGWPELEPEALARLAILGLLYNSADVCFRCLHLYDEKLSTQLAATMLELGS